MVMDIEKGIKFECQGSGNCCVSRGSYGFVYLSKKDIKKLSIGFKTTEQNFIKNYCQKTDGFIHLKELKKNKGNCIFLKDNKCTVYKSRPTQCRTWPFWPENMNNKTWNEDIAKNCPGVGKGKVKSKEEILKQVQTDYENEINIRNKN